MTDPTIKIDIRNHGFQAEAFTPDMYILGASKFAGAAVINPKGDWSPHKPVRELQNKNGLETMNCSNYGTYNALETLGIFHDFVDFPRNFAERYSGVLTETTPEGNAPHKVIELIRTEIGGVDEGILPFDESIDTWEKYYSPKPMLQAYLNIGKKLITKFEIGHDWVFIMQGSPEEKATKLEYALQRGTVCVSVLAWKSRDGIFFKARGESDNHWVQLLRRNPDGTWRVYDHYDQVEKDLAADYDFGFAKVYYLRRYAPGEVQQKKSQLAKVVEGLIAALKNLLAAILALTPSGSKKQND